MDPITHTLFGASLAAAGLRRRSARATATLLIGANLPDIDVVVIPFGMNLELRRGWTHGALSMAVLPLLLWALVLAWGRWRRPGADAERGPPLRPRALLAIAVLAVWSHPVLDLLNTYGVRLLMPFSDQWVYGDALFIVDPWIWLALGGAVWAGMRGRERAAAGALVLCGAYALGMSGVGRWSEARVAAELSRGGAEPRRLLASPVPFDPTVRRVIADLGDRYVYADVSIGRSPTVRFDTLQVRLRLDEPAVRAAAASPEARGFLQWARYPFADVVWEDGGATVVFADARFAERPGTGWAGRRIRLDAQPAAAAPSPRGSGTPR
jgi:inner membrane protein